MPIIPSHSITWTEGITRTAGLAACLDRYGDTTDLKALNACCDTMQKRIDQYRGCFSPVTTRSRSPRSVSTPAGLHHRRASERGVLVLPAAATRVSKQEVSKQHALTGFTATEGFKRQSPKHIQNAQQENDDYGAMLHKLLPQVPTTLIDRDQALVRAVLWVCDGARISSASTRFDIDVVALEREIEQLEAIGPEAWVQGLSRGRGQQPRA